jgi:hypothetical protein
MSNSRLGFTIPNYLSSIIYYLLSIIYYLLSIIYYLSLHGL